MKTDFRIVLFTTATLALCGGLVSAQSSYNPVDDELILGVRPETDENRPTTLQRSELLGLSAVSRGDGGLEITSVEFNTPGYEMQLEAGDVIYAADGETVSSMAELEQAARNANGRLTFSLRNVRTGQHQFHRAKFVMPRINNPVGFIPRLGVTVEILPADGGMLVESVKRNSIGSALGLRSGDVLQRVNNVPIHRITNMTGHLRNQFTISFYRPNSRQMITARYQDFGASPLGSPIGNSSPLADDTLYFE